MYHIVCGTYETPLYGYLLDWDPNPSTDEPISSNADSEKCLGGVKLNPVFAYAPHTGAIKSIISSSQWLVTTSTDETIKVYDMINYKELGIITRGFGVISCLAFFQDTYLFCGTECGKILVWKAGTWTQLSSLESHKDRINSISIHPNGVIALTLSKDKTLKLWDLTKGTVEHTNKLKIAGDLIKWSPSGQSYFIVTNNKIVRYSITGKKIGKASENKRIHDAVWLTEDLIATGGEDRALCIWKASRMEALHHITTFFKNRIKAIDILCKKNDSSSGQTPLIVTISSDERMRIWDIDQSTTVPIHSIHLDARLISLTCAPISKSKKARSKSRSISPSSCTKEDEPQSKLAKTSTS